MTQAQSLADLSQQYVQSALGNRNLFVDGNFDSWITPGGVAITAGNSTINAATMYRFGAGAGGASTVGLNAFTPGTEPLGMTTPVAGGPYIDQATASTGSVAAGTAPFMFQNVENVRTLQARSATFSCWLINTVGGNITIPSIICRQNFGSGGSPSAQVIADVAVNWVVGSAYQRYSVRLDVPSISGKTLGTNNDHSLQVGLWLPSGVVSHVIPAQWQLERSPPGCSSDLNGNGGLPTPFEYRGPQAEAARVQRYYQSTSASLVQGYVGTAGASVYNDFSLNTNMRSNPALTILGTPTYSNASGYSLAILGPNSYRGSIVISAVGFGLGYLPGLTADSRL